MQANRAILCGNICGIRSKPNGWIVICNGEDEFKRTAPNEELTKRGFEWFSHKSIEGGIIYNYRKHVVK